MPAGPMNARRYIDSLRDGREVWIDGRRVADVTKEHATAPVTASITTRTLT